MAKYDELKVIVIELNDQRAEPWSIKEWVRPVRRENNASEQ